jgi:hypothetical protein
MKHFKRTSIQTSRRLSMKICVLESVCYRCGCTSDQSQTI